MRLPLSYLSLISLLLLSASLLCGETGATPPAKTGTITGTIRFTGKVPPAKKIMATDGSTILHRDLVVDGTTKGLRYVVAILDNAKPQPKAKNAKPAMMDQCDMIFTPRVIAVQHGQQVWFENSDLCNHSVMAISPVPKNSFNVLTPPNDSYKTSFELQKRPILIGCSLHAWMRAWVYVVPHPWFAVTDNKGTFTIRNVPPGKYTLRLEHPDTRTTLQRQIEVRGGKTVRVTVDWKEVKR